MYFIGGGGEFLGYALPKVKSTVSVALQIYTLDLVLYCTYKLVCGSYLEGGREGGRWRIKSGGEKSHGCPPPTMDSYLG